MTDRPMKTTFVQHIDFTKPVRFARDVYYFEYGGVRFKLVQNDPSKYCDAILTVMPNGDRVAEGRAFAAAGEFVSALAWKVGLPMAVAPGGGMGLPGEVALEDARCSCFGLPQFVTTGNIRGHSLSRIAAIETDEQRRALSLVREAQSANKAILAFLLYWQVMDIRPRRLQSPQNLGKWVDSMIGGGALGLHLHAADRAVLGRHCGKRSLGTYFEDDCRHAIAHLRRDPGRKTFVFDDHTDLVRMRVSVQAVRDLAEQYIRKVLDLTKGMTLYRQGSQGFPLYIRDGAVPRGQGYVLAYR